GRFINACNACFILNPLPIQSNNCFKRLFKSYANELVLSTKKEEELAPSSSTLRFIERFSVFLFPLRVRRQLLSMHRPRQKHAHFIQQEQRNGDKNIGYEIRRRYQYPDENHNKIGKPAHFAKPVRIDKPDRR